jgi:putative flippase GtrA
MIGLFLTMRATPALKSQLLAFARFGLVGATTAAIYFFVMWFGDAILGLRYIAFVTLAYSLSTVFHFLANRLFTFSAARARLKSQITRYIIMFLVNYLITILVVGLCVEKLHMSPYTVIIISVFLTMCVGYILGSYWVFKVGKEAE